MTEMEKKENWKKFRKIIRDNNIQYLYHFTDKKNLKSIKEHGGLFSWYYCKRNGIKIKRPGGSDLGRELDLRFGLENYVRLSFTKNHPMMYVAMNDGRIKKPVILEIDPSLIYSKGTKYSDKNATRNDHLDGKKLGDFKRIKFDIVLRKNHFDLIEDLIPYYQAEILVTDHIPLSFINRILRAQ